LVALLDEIFLQRNAEDWMRLLEAKGFVVALVARPSEAVHDRQMRENGVIVPLKGGGYTVSSPLWIAGVEKAVATPAPKIGEHGAAILRERGITEEQIAELGTKGVIG
jgi:crotonobetainyl-CoA:carnitine CoA-transferase CaiB-like acyl-CoA transferase